MCGKSASSKTLLATTRSDESTTVLVSRNRLQVWIRTGFHAAVLPEWVELPPIDSVHCVWSCALPYRPVGVLCVAPNGLDPDKPLAVLLAWPGGENAVVVQHPVGDAQIVCGEMRQGLRIPGHVHAAGEPDCIFWLETN